MTHPTEAGERERLAIALEDMAHAHVESARSSKGEISDFLRSEAKKLRRAANLLRTEPGGEAFDWRDLMGEILHGDLYLTGPDIQVLSNDAVEEIFECYRRPTTPVEPDPNDSELAVEAINVIRAAREYMPEATAERTEKTITRLLGSIPSSAPVEEWEP